MSEKQVSFIIPHKGREHYLLQTLDSIIAQDIDPASLEIIVVTQNDDVSERLLAFGEKIALSVYPRPAGDTISALRNHGVTHAGGRYLAFIDADVSLSANWVRCMIDTLEALPGRVLTSAMQINSPQAPPLERIRTALSNAVVDHSVAFLPGRNLFLRRETFDELRGFPEHLVTCEDYYFTERAGKLGELYYTSAATYIHLGEDRDFRQMFKKEIWRGQSNLLSIKGRTVPLSEIPSFITPVAVVFFFLAALVALIAGYPLIALFSLLLCLLPVMFYSLRLYTIAGKQVAFIDVLRFYLYYFPARAIGTVGGLFKTITSKSHHS